MEFFKEYPAVVTAIGSLAGIVLGFFLGRWSTKESRSFIRRAAVYDRRINEARDVIESWDIFISYTKTLVRIHRDGRSREEVDTRMKILEKELSSFPLIMREASRKDSSIEILNDDELTRLKFELLLNPMRKLVEYGKKFTAIAKYKNYDFDKLIEEIDFQKYDDFAMEANKIITKMKIRLDELDKTLK